MSEDFMTILVFGALAIGVAFGIGRSTGDDYWHKPCDNYSVSAYQHKEIPARCME